MRKVLIAALILIFMSATAIAGDWDKNRVETRWGMQVDLGVPAELTPCRHTIAWAKVHDYGVSFTVMGWGCTPGHVFSVWTLIGEDPTDLSIPTLNCGGGIVLPNGHLKIICDTPIGNLTDTIEQCQGIPAPPDFVIWAGGCAQTINPTYVGKGGFRMEDLHIDILAHDMLEKDISMAQIRTLSTCSFWDAPPPFGFGPGPYPREDSCIPMRFSFLSR